MNKKKNYKSLGFVELIISIGVAGIALMVLMSMAANSMREAVRYERQDALTRLAISGALVVRNHVETANDPRAGVDFLGLEDFCYALDFENSRVVFFPSYGINTNLKNQENLQIDIEYDVENDFGDTHYVTYCVDRIEESSDILVNTYIGYVETGYVDCNDCGIEPYRHNILVNVLQN